MSCKKYFALLVADWIRVSRLLVTTLEPMDRYLAEKPGSIPAGWNSDSYIPSGQKFSSEQMIELSRGATAMIVGDDDMDEDFFTGCSDSLELVVKWGIGTDSIDFAAAQRRGIRVRNTPGVFGDEAAELAMAYILILSRNIFESHEAVRNGEWFKTPGSSLRGKRISILGLGSIGKQLAFRAQSFGMVVSYTDPVADSTEYKKVQLDTLLAGADYLVLTCPSTDETRGIISSKTFAKLKPGASLINVARGDLVIENDLVAALRSGRVSKAALDVYESEPLPLDSDLRNCSNVIFGCHNASNTFEASDRASSKALEILLEEIP